jgi:hypothetical protein
LAAESNFLRAIAITETHWGSDHPDLADYLNNLAGVYRDQARFAEAQALYHRCVEMWERLSGSDHPNVALALNNLGGLYAYRLAMRWRKRSFSAPCAFKKKSSG